ncbi:MAG TPA: DUF4397 domain-containing protein [Myxococcaceae bacterium]|nr:DUF4397 domain-containing protein [Myxococcaceae bacterium]
MTLHRGSWLILAFAVGCGDNSGGGGGGPDGGASGPPQNKAWVRFGNLSPDAPPIDICVSPMDAGQWGSPVLAGAGVQGGLTYPAMSRVTYIDAGWLDFRAVAPGGNCSTPIGIDLTAQQLNEHGTYTITSVGLLNPGTTSGGPYRLVQYIEHQESGDAGMARMRFINLSPNAPPLWDGVADGGAWVSQFTEVEVPFKSFAAGTGAYGVIYDGYQDMVPNPALPLAIRATRPQDTPNLYQGPIPLRAGTITAVWVIGLLGGTGERRLGYFLCDETPAADGGTTTCHRE